MDGDRTVNAATLRPYLLSARLAIARFGWLSNLACLLCMAGLAAWGWGVPQLRAQLDLQRHAISAVRQAMLQADIPAPPPARPIAEERLANFYDVLGDRRYAEQQIKTLFAIAAKAQLALSQAEYRPAFDRNGRYHTYQIVLPVKGSYAAIRQFCEQTLLAIPFASLDEMSFRRDAIGNRVLEAKLHITLYLGDPNSPAQAGSILTATSEDR
jgi:hypothetical protein